MVVAYLLNRYSSTYVGTNALPLTAPTRSLRTVYSGHTSVMLRSNAPISVIASMIAFSHRKSKPSSKLSPRRNVYTDFFPSVFICPVPLICSRTRTSTVEPLYASASLVSTNVAVT